MIRISYLAKARVLFLPNFSRNFIYTFVFREKCKTPEIIAWFCKGAQNAKLYLFIVFPKARSKLCFSSGEVLSMRIRFSSVRFWLFRIRSFIFVFGLQTEHISLTLLGTNPVSPRGTQLKNPLLHRSSLSFRPRCIIRRKIVWSCPSVENRSIFGFGGTSDLLDQMFASRQWFELRR